MIDSTVQKTTHESASGFTTIDKILENFLKNQAKKTNLLNKKIQNDNCLSIINEQKRNDFTSKNLETENKTLNESQSKRKLDSMSSKSLRQINMTVIKRDYSLSYSDTSTIFSERLSANNEHTKIYEKSEMLKQKLKKALLTRPSPSTDYPEKKDSSSEIKDEKPLQSCSYLKQKRTKRKKSVSFAGKATLFSYSYCTTEKKETENCNALAQSILKRLDAILDDESCKSKLTETKCIISPADLNENLKKGIQEFNNEEPCDKNIEYETQLTPELNENKILDNNGFNDEETNDEQISVETHISPSLQTYVSSNENNADDKQEIIENFAENVNSDNNSNQITYSPTQTGSNNHVNEKDLKMESNPNEENEEQKKAYENKPMRFFVIERLGHLVDFDKKRNEPIRNNPQEEKLNLVFDKIEKLLRQNGKLNRQKSRLSNAFSAYINNIV